MAKKKWMQDAVKHPGAATRAAKKEGMSVHEWAEENKGAGGVKGKRANLALTFAKIAHKKGHKKGK